MYVTAIGALTDTTWVGAPGEPIPSGVAIRVLGPNREPAANASLTWEAVGRGAKLIAASPITDANGLATAVWQLGTDASEQQQLQLMVTWRQHARELTLHAKAVPHVVAQLRLSVDSPAVLRVGDSLPVVVTAVDPFGNTFAAPPARLSLTDTTLGRVSGSFVIGGPKRGTTELTVTTDYVSSRVPVSIVQYVAAIVPQSNMLSFRSLGAVLPIAYEVRDDHGCVVADTVATAAIADTSVAHLADGGVRALRPGATELQLAIGSVTSAVAIDVEQRIASLRLLRDTIHFDALHDTTTIHAIAQDSLGNPVLNPDLVFHLGDADIAALSPDLSLQSVMPGMTVLTMRDAVTGITASAPVVVQQRVATIEVTPVSFDALGDTVSIAAVARDRLGSPVSGVALEYSISDTSVATFEGAGRLRSIREGQVVLTARDPQTGTVATADVTIKQRVTSLQLSLDTVSFDALTDSTPVAFAARDRLGNNVASAQVTYSSMDPAIATVSAEGAVRSVGNGTALVIGRSLDGPADTVRVAVAQQVASIALGQDSLVFESLRAVQVPIAHPLDRLGSVVSNSPLSYVIEDAQIADVGQGGEVRALANGSTGVVITAAGHTGRVSIRITQRPTHVHFSVDTLRFDALGDSASLTATALDSLGSPVAGGITGVAFADPTIANVTDASTVHATGNGVTHATIAVAGITGQVVIDVNQVPVTLNVSSTFGSPVITLPAGAPLSLSCRAADRNGYAIARDPVFVGSVKGTVTGSGCADARVARSGYDTLFFRLGDAQASLSAIVATAPDSVGVLAAAETLTTVTRDQYVGEDLANPLILALRPLVNDIMAAYGNPTTNLDRARAIRDWVARTAIHPWSGLHPGGSTSNISVLPPGKAWADANAAGMGKLDQDRGFWGGVGANGYAMLDRLLGTLDPATGLRADDGLMIQVNGARYRIRDVEAYKYVQCSYQDIMLNVLWAAAGLQGMLISTVGHDPAAVFIPELGRWVYEDPEFNEEYLLDGTGQPLSPTDLLTLSSAGEASRLHGARNVGPSFDPAAYGGSSSYINEANPGGMVIMGSQLNNRLVGVVVAGTGSWPMRYVQIDVPRLAEVPSFNNPIVYAPVTSADAFPSLGVVVQEPRLEDSVYVAQLSSTFPGHQRFERRVDGASWETVGAVDVLPVGACRVEYRSLDGVGNISSSAVLDVWAPRAAGFVEAGLAGSVRRQARYCA